MKASMYYAPRKKSGEDKPKPELQETTNAVLKNPLKTHK